MAAGGYAKLTKAELIARLRTIEHGAAKRADTAEAPDSTKRQPAEVALREKRAILQAILENTMDFVFMKDCRGRYLAISSAAARALGKSPSEIIGKGDAAIFPPDSTRRIRKKDRLLMASGGAEHFEETLTLAGRVLHLSTSKSVCRDFAGKIIGLVGISRDVTARKQAEEAMARHQLLSRHARDPLLLMFLDGRIAEANQAAVDLYGYTHEQLRHMGIQDLRRLDDPETVRRQMIQAQANGILFEAVHVCKNGAEVPVEVSSRGVTIEGRAMLLSVIRDITVRRRAAAAAAAEKRVLELIAAGAPLGRVLETLVREAEGQSSEGLLGSVLLMDESGERLLHGAAPSLPAAYNRAIHGLRIGPGVGSCGTAAFERRAVFVTDIAADPRWKAFRKLAARHRLGACCSTPLLSSKGRLLGTMAMYYRRPHDPGEQDRELIERATKLASITIERKQAEEALARLNATLEQQVAERTEELTQSNRRLHAEGLERRRLEAEVLRIGDEERQRLAADLHDGICQELAGLGFMTSTLAKDLRKALQAAAAGRVELIKRKVFEVGAHTRQVAHGMNPVVAGGTGLMDALRQLAATTAVVHRIRCFFSCPDEVLLEDSRAANELYRIAQEAVHNALRHSRARRVTIRLARGRNELRLSVKDNGAGFSTHRSPAHGMGLRVMKYRAELLHGQITVQARKVGGTEVLCRVPQSREIS